jgi:hypothetical protein
MRQKEKFFEDKIRQSGYYPKVVVMVDDKKKHLLDVETQLKSHDSSIQFVGIEYEGAYEYAPDDISKKDFQKFWEDLAKKAKAMWPRAS